MKNQLLGAVFALIAIVGLSVYFKDDIKTVFFGEEVAWVRMGGVQIFVSIADTPETRRQGLSGSSGLGELEGKLFMFESLGTPSIWMKDMNYPIDVFWISEDLKIIHIESNMSPDSYPKTFSAPAPSRYILETNAGVAEQYGIRNGDSVSFSKAVLERSANLLPAK